MRGMGLDFAGGQIKNLSYKKGQIKNPSYK